MPRYDVFLEGSDFSVALVLNGTIEHVHRAIALHLKRTEDFEHKISISLTLNPNANPDAPRYWS